MSDLKTEEIEEGEEIEEDEGEEDEDEVEEDEGMDSKDFSRIGSLSITEVAKEVIAGKWGQGQDKRLRLSEAGYNANKVQKEVVRLRNNL